MNNIGESINNITAILSIVSSHPYRTKNERYPQNEKTREACAKRYFFHVERVARRETKTGNCLHP
jgi:hypothetical protein